MEKKHIRDARLRLIRQGDPNSTQNKNLRKAAFDIIIAVTQAFFPDPKNASPGGFGKMPMDIVLTECPLGALVGDRSISGPLTIIVVNGKNEIAFTQKGVFPNGMVSIWAAEWIAKRVAESGLYKVLAELENLHGVEAARTFADLLGIRRRE